MTLVKASLKGEFLLPKEVLDAHGFADGAEIEVSGDLQQIVLKLAKKGDETSERKLTMAEFIARIPKYEGPPVTQELIDQAVADGARERWNKANRVNGDND